MNGEDYRKQNLNEWDEILDNLFDSKIPENSVWVNEKEIINVLSLISHNHNSNHTFFPSGGGLDLYGAGPSTELKCIELYFSSEKQASIVRPERLIFQSFGKPYEWAYFRLDTKKLNPSGVYENNQDTRDEELTEISPGKYVDRYHWDDNFYGHDESGAEQPLPSTARLITRHFSGSFVIFAKSSIYNRIGETYDGRHSKMTADEFRRYIEKASSA